MLSYWLVVREMVEITTFDGMVSTSISAVYLRKFTTKFSASYFLMAEKSRSKTKWFSQIFGADCCKATLIS